MQPGIEALARRCRVITFSLADEGDGGFIINGVGQCEHTGVGPGHNHELGLGAIKVAHGLTIPMHTAVEAGLNLPSLAHGTDTAVGSCRTGDLGQRLQHRIELVDSRAVGGEVAGTPTPRNDSVASSEIASPSRCLPLAGSRRSAARY